MTDLKNKKILIVGLGESGLAAVRALIPCGALLSVQDQKSGADMAPETVSLFKSNDIRCYLGETPSESEKFDMLVLSPGVPPDLEFIKKARQNGSEAIGEMELAYRLCKGSFAAITGTNGKTTTTALLGEIFKNAKKDAFVVGNIGTAAISAVNDATSGSWLITEVSSFQLETIKDFRPRISAILNITPDHLDRHGDMKSYIEAKARIFENQSEGDHFIVNYDDETAFRLSQRCKAKVTPFSRLSELKTGVFLKDGMISARGENGEYTEICRADAILLKGSHNLENALAAAAMALCAKIPADIIAQTLLSFGGVPHRLEPCGVINGVSFVNDSKGTNPDASIKAVEAVDGPIILIAGGYDKKSNFEEFIDSFGGKVKSLILLGDTARIIKETAENKGFHNIVILKNMDECVKEAFRAAAAGDTVLLSPACASWDMYSNFSERGEDFKDCVRRLLR